MKKLIFLFFIPLILIGCNQNTNTTTDNYSDNTNNVENNATNNSDDKSYYETAIKQLKHEDLIGKYNQAIIKTNQGDIKVEFYNNDSPLTVNCFLNLAQNNFYNGTKFHRVIKDFMIQGGDPNSKDDDWSDDGTGDPGYKFKDEINDHKLVEGSLAMANSGPNTNGSQFFIVTTAATSWLDGKHTNFGRVIDGLDIVKEIENVETNERDHPLEDIVIESIELLSSK